MEAAQARSEYVCEECGLMVNCGLGWANGGTPAAPDTSKLIRYLSNSFRIMKTDYPQNVFSARREMINGSFRGWAGNGPLATAGTCYCSTWRLKSSDIREGKYTEGRGTHGCHPRKQGPFGIYYQALRQAGHAAPPLLHASQRSAQVCRCAERTGDAGSVRLALRGLRATHLPDSIPLKIG